MVVLAIRRLTGLHAATTPHVYSSSDSSKRIHHLYLLVHPGSIYQRRDDFDFSKSESGKGDCSSYRRKESSFNSKELKTAISDFTIKANYSFWSDLKREEARHMTIDHRTASLSSEFVLDLARFEMDVDSPQFFILTNVTRNVLLEPPPKVKNKKRTAYMDENDGRYRGVSTAYSHDITSDGASAASVVGGGG